MTIKRGYQTLLRLYPADYKALFAAEMLNTFVKADEACRARGRLRFMHFAFAELIGLLIGAAAEWVSKLLTGHWPGLRHNIQLVGGCASLSTGRIQDEVAETEKRIDDIIGNMVHAIANHDFPKARFCSDQERAAREHLRRLQEGHSPDGF
ncbi:MAG: hypothetical protein M3Y72_15605 [Acidobacteriota bacterium]|nr:hypothetical protein [Acidobacteriota bacterium]